MRIKPGLIAAVIVSFMLCGCASVKMDIKTYSDPDHNLTVYKKFRIEPADKENPLLTKELAAMLKRKLSQRGFVRDEAAPDFIVILDFHSTPVRYYIPPSTQYLPQYVPGETKTYTGAAGGTNVQVTEQTAGKYELRPQVVGGHTDTVYHNSIKIFFAKPSRTGGPAKDNIFWRGEGDIEHYNSDIRATAPYLLDEILDEFPYRSGKPNKRPLKEK
ncbi:MAG: DUF4136 domain-containing protein [Nitrospirae bacterium]|nr:MAG: DUF4136 domain-containing protein [Nitrospirota bacterium]